MCDLNLPQAARVETNISRWAMTVADRAGHHNRRPWQDNPENGEQVEERRAMSPDLAGEVIDVLLD